MMLYDFAIKSINPYSLNILYIFEKNYRIVEFKL